MSNDTDFAVLYHILGLRPGCRLDELRLAYRRQVAALHPDRNPGDGSELQRLNALYEAALDFMRRNGRLPGAPPPPTAATANATVRAIPVPPGHDTAHATRLRTTAALLLVLLVTALVWGAVEQHRDATPAVDAVPTLRHATGPAARPPTLALDMRPTDVRRLEGEPIQADETLWEYGPSWVAFRCGRVSGWYSSPLHPLHTAARRMEPGDTLPRCKTRPAD